MIESPVERLLKTNPDMEVWWDSSPLVYEQWTQKMLDAASPERRPVLEEQLRRLFVVEDPARSVFRGCTTNPPLSLKAVQADPEFWSRWVDDFIRAHPDLDQKAVFWATYKEVVKRGAEMFLPMFEASNGRYGWISGQLDPRLFTEKEIMIQQAEELSALQPNVMIKVPASQEGIEVLEVLTSRGISTNVTTCFTLPQILAASQAVERGVAQAQEKGVDLTRWRSVITMMIGRLTERKALVEQARRRGIELTWQDKHWFGIAVFRRAYRILQDRGAVSKLLACSLRHGPVVAGKPRFWDIEKLAGGEIVFTFPPYVLEPLFAIGDGLHFRPQIEEEVPEEVMDKLMRIPYAIQAYDPNGMALEQFNTHPATLYTIEQFSKAANGLEAFVAERIALVREAVPTG